MKEVLKLESYQEVLWEWWNYHKGDRGHQLLRFRQGEFVGIMARPVPARLPYSTAFPPLIQSVRDIFIWMEPM